MAHRGRAYPLLPSRCWNADAPYPFWLPDEVLIQVPKCTGVFVPQLYDKIFRWAPGIYTGIGAFYQGSFTDISITTTFHLELTITWLNLLTDSRRFTLLLWGHYFPLGFPPVNFDLCKWQSDDTNVAPLHAAVIEIDTVYDPPTYTPLGPAGYGAKTWID